MSVLKQAILTMHTREAYLRCAADGWSADDGSRVKQEKEIGLSGDFKGFVCYSCPLKAMGDGWRLMAPPQLSLDFDPGEMWYCWWFEKMVDNSQK